MSIRRVFLDWSQTPLASTLDYLVQRFRAADALDLSAAMLVVPGGRGGRRLLELLVDRAEREKLLLRPPRIVTVGKLPEQLYEAQRPFADSLVQQLAWIQALQKTPSKKLELLIPVVPTKGDLTAWLGLGGAMARLHLELAAQGLDFAQVARDGCQLAGFCETDRWQTLATVQQKYLKILDDLGLWDLQTARLVAIQRNECQTDAQIILIGTSDLNRVQQLMLDQVAAHVTALVFAPQELAARFDPYGCLVAEAWQETEIPLEDHQVDVVGDPQSQATAVVRAISALDGQYGCDEISVGVPDERIVPYLEHQLAQCGITARHGAGKPTSHSAPYRLLSAVADYLQAQRFVSLAALIRHPAITDWLAARQLDGDWATFLDTYYRDHLPGQLDGQWLGEEETRNRLQELHASIGQLLGDLLGPAQPVDEWCQPILDFLLRVFGQLQLDPRDPAQRPILTACQQIHAVLCDDRAIPPQLVPKVSAAEALRLILQQLSSQRVAPLAEPGAIELLGWLELPLDDAPVLIVTSFNEGVVPSSLNGDLFLPNQLRRALGVEDNSRRYARDAYTLSLLAASRQRLTLIAGRRTVDGDPLVPSRLLFASSPSSAAHRAARIFSADAAQSDSVVLAGGLVPAATSAILVPKPRPLARPIRSMRVTEFRDYLACPYRYYLRHCLKLECLSDAAEELDGLAFGTLMHEVLSTFGEGPLAASTDPKAIFAALGESLDQIVADTFGADPLPVIQVQVEQLRARLRPFAQWQAEWAALGWRIEHVERQPDDGRATLLVDNRPMFLRGRIDRIDVNEHTGMRTIFDYKSSNSPDPPDKTHRSGDQWVDLQLPLYRHLAAGMGIDGRLQLGYIVLPKDPSQTGCRLAEWTEGELAEADRTAEEVVRGVRQERFWPPTSPAPDWFEEFAAICQDDQLTAAALAADDEGRPA